VKVDGFVFEIKWSTKRIKERLVQRKKARNGGHGMLDAIAMTRKSVKVENVEAIFPSWDSCITVDKYQTSAKIIDSDVQSATLLLFAIKRKNTWTV
jgi:hypothetical protein